MKVLVITLVALAAVVAAKNIDAQNVATDFDLNQYHPKIGIPLANEIRTAEAEPQSTRVVGGMPAIIGQFSYQAGIIIDLISGETSVCGGAILNTLRVVTAAHCWWTRRDQAMRFTVVAGSVTLNTGGLRRVTSHVVMHGGWNPELLENNIAVAYLPTALVYSSTVSAVGLPIGSEYNENFAGLFATISGYGITRDGVTVADSPTLNFANVHVITNAECLRTFANRIDNNHICSSGGVSGGSACDGDGGSPLVMTRNSRRILIGLASFGSTRGCDSGAPAVYTRITSYLNWLLHFI